MIGHAQGCSVEVGLACTCSWPYVGTDQDRLAVKSQATRVAGQCGRCDRAVQALEDSTWVDAMGSDQCAAGGRHQVIQAPDGYHLCPQCQGMHAYPAQAPRVKLDTRSQAIGLTTCDECMAVYLGTAWCHDRMTTHVGTVTVLRS